MSTVEVYQEYIKCLIRIILKVNTCKPDTLFCYHMVRLESYRIADALLAFMFRVGLLPQDITLYSTTLASLFIPYIPHVKIYNKILTLTPQPNIQTA